MRTQRTRDTGRKDTLGRTIKESENAGIPASGSSADASASAALRDFGANVGRAGMDRRAALGAVESTRQNKKRHRELAGIDLENTPAWSQFDTLQQINRFVDAATSRAMELIESGELAGMSDHELGEAAQDVVDHMYEGAEGDREPQELSFVNNLPDPMGKIVDHSSTMDRNDVRQSLIDGVVRAESTSLDPRQDYEWMAVSYEHVSDDPVEQLKAVVKDASLIRKSSYPMIKRNAQSKREVAQDLLSRSDLSDMSGEEISESFSREYSQALAKNYDRLDDSELYDTYAVRVPYSEASKSSPEIVDAAHAAVNYSMGDLVEGVLKDTRDEYISLRP